MELSGIRYADGIRDGVQTAFGGLNHNYAAGDGELYDMTNLTGDFFPLLATRQKRRKTGTLSDPGGIFSHDKLAWTDGTKFYFNGTEKGAVTQGAKTFVAIGAYLVILPDKKYYDTLTDSFGSMESKWSGASLTFTNGTLYDEAATANCIQGAVDWRNYFRPGDAVTISGCTTHPENNKTPIIREILWDANNQVGSMNFYENVFTLDADDTPYTESGTLKIERTVPDLIYACENENRLWGSDGQRIYASKLGDIFNWNVFDGLDTDSWCWPADEAGIVGGITACVSFLGYPVFFKQDKIFKVYGNRPDNFQAMGGAATGVMAGSGRSLAIAGETLYYLSTAGFMAYGGGLPRPIGQAFGLERQKNAVAGSDGLKYYVSFQDAANAWHMCVYDPTLNAWYKEDGTQAVGFAQHEGNLYLLSAAGDILVTGTILGTPGTAEADFQWSAEFGDFTERSRKSPETGANKKGVSKIQIRLELDTGASCTVYLRFDSTGNWIQAGETITATQKRSFYLPIVPHRADHYRMKITGSGGCRIYSIGREFYSGSELKSLQGRN